MRWFSFPACKSEGCGATVLLFGLGLIGDAVAAALQRRLGPRGKTINYDWNFAAARDATRRGLLSALAGPGADPTTASGRIAFVWTAGRSSFSSTVAAMDDEAAKLAEIVGFAAKLSEISRRAVAMHLVTSAGGLFEGQRDVHCDTPPTPLRAYGFGKLRQEDCAAAARGVDVHVYRPSSVYGYCYGGRLGLISALIRNALDGRATRIAGAADTIRDYVFADDIGRFIADRIIEDSPTPQHPLLLASGRPATIGEIIATVRRVVHMPPLLQYDPAPENARHMSFRPVDQPGGWRSTVLETGIYLTADRIQRYRAFPR